MQAAESDPAVEMVSIFSCFLSKDVSLRSCSQSWEVRMSSSKGIAYFFNPATKESSWDPPSSLSQDQISSLPGADLLNVPSAGGAAASGKPAPVRASHLLVKHSGSRRPSSWKEPKVTRSKEEAIDILKGYQQTINASADPAATFGELATEHSDCSSHGNKGDLGWFGPGQMQKAFEKGAYGLEVGGISGIVESESGVHLILRTG